MQLVGFLVAFPFIWLLSLLPLRVLYVISDILYFPVFYLLKYRKKVVYMNIKKVFPEYTDEEVDQTAKKFYRYFCGLLMEIIKVVSMSEKQLKRRYKYKNPEVLYDLYNKGKHAIAVTAHYGNWEWISAVSDVTPYKSMSVYKPLNNKYVDKFLTKVRSRYGADLVPMAQAVRYILRYKKENRLSISCFIADQRPFINYIQYWTKFLGQDTPVYLGTEKLAKQLDLAVVFLRVVPVKRGYYEVEVVKLFENAKDTAPYEITEAHLKELEKLIREKPEYWLWTHNRWKYKYEPEMYNKND